MPQGRTGAIVSFTAKTRRREGIYVPRGDCRDHDAMRRMGGRAGVGLDPAVFLGSVVPGRVGRDGRAGRSAALVALPAAALGVGVRSEVTPHMYIPAVS